MAIHLIAIAVFIALMSASNVSGFMANGHSIRSRFLHARCGLTVGMVPMSISLGLMGLTSYWMTVMAIFCWATLAIMDLIMVLIIGHKLTWHSQSQILRWGYAAVIGGPFIPIILFILMSQLSGCLLIRSAVWSMDNDDTDTDTGETDVDTDTGSL